MVSSARWLAVLRLAAVSLPGTLAAATPPPPLPAERISVQQLPPSSHHWVYVFDDAFANEIDMRVHLYDGDHYRRLGQIDAGYYSSFNLSPDGATTVVATTYFARGSRGTRTDVVEFTDNHTLAVTGEIVLPPKRAQTLPTPFNLAYSADARLLYVSYVTPAASFGVLDPVKKTVLGEIDTAGCVLVIPSGAYRVSSICESGRLLTVTLDAAGKELARAMSEPFFDADRDPVFVQGIPTARGYAFMSFLGKMHEIDFSGEQPRISAPWSLVTAENQGVWRPGAQQVGAIHIASGRLYVPMHKGGEGTHKDGGTEIWVFDMATHQRVARWPMATQGLTRIIAVQVSQDAAPVLFAATDSAQLAVLDPRDGHIRHVEKHFGQTPWQMLIP
ncbi:MAG: amine dehydrogenase [Gammaproteobacteria bacterium]|nr:amine dehydrogenase [Gammaproteobacteria bacterium]